MTDLALAAVLKTETGHRYIYTVTDSGDRYTVGIVHGRYMVACMVGTAAVRTRPII